MENPDLGSVSSSRASVAASAKHWQLLGALTLLVCAIEAIMIWVGVPLEFLDGRLYYPPAEIERVLTAQGEAGRMIYRQLELIDLFFILLYTWLLVEFTRSLRRKPSAGTRPDRWAFMAFLPISVATAADAIETTGILALLARFPEDGPPGLARLISVATPVKWAALFVSLVQIVVLAARRALDWRRRAQMSSLASN